MARPAIPFEDKTHTQQLRTIRNLKHRGSIEEANRLKLTMTKTSKKYLKPKTSQTKKKTEVKRKPAIDKKVFKESQIKPKVSQTKKTNIKLKPSQTSFETLKQKNESIIETLKLNLGDVPTLLIDIKTGKKFKIDEAGSINLEPTKWNLFKQTIDRKSWEVLVFFLNINYSKSILNLFKFIPNLFKFIPNLFIFIPLLALASTLTAYLIFQSQISYKLLNFPLATPMAVAIELIIGILSFWTVFNSSKMIKGILAGILLFQGYILFSGSEITNSTKDDNQIFNNNKIIEQKKNYSEKIKSLKQKIVENQKKIESYKQTTALGVQGFETKIEIQKKRNVYSAKETGVFALTDKLLDYREQRAKGLSSLEGLSSNSKSQDLIIDLRSKRAELKTHEISNSYSDIALKFLIVLALMLNIFIFHKIGEVFKARKEDLA